MKVLVGVDGSESGFDAAGFVCRLLDPARDEVILYYSPPTIHLLKNELKANLPVRAQQALCDAIFGEAKARLPEAFADSITTLQGQKRPSHGLLVAADETRADLMVVGQRGLGRFERLLVGSVTRSVAHSATIPVLAVKPPSPDRDSDGSIRVLLACDGSPASQSAGSMLRNFTWPPNSEGYVIRVLESLIAREIPDWLDQQARSETTEVLAKAWTERHDAEKQSTSEQLVGYCTDLPEIFRQQRPIVTDGHPTKEILKAIESIRGNLVVVGARRVGKLSRLVLGSTSDYLLGHAPCSVLVVREHEQA